ncbi:hypothetical protein [Hymenobacter cheonanensis]|uniref:hypothetical protein n=1 Tax=Hymenobacter sp. CA2-7 TaxID=3063993 RepID=UPI002713AE0C|nr:hypothetical protein [Hymenobacter sp. CA2-7]MDO7885740.1 hypothetical protein [Hymenobacter sp. CA2-7]
MDKKEYRWQVNVLKQVYPDLKLTFEQAEQLYLMEQQTKDLPRGKYLTDWERLDFELATMQRILSAEQLARYLPDHATAVAQYGAQVESLTKLAANELAYNREVLQFYRETVLPTLYADPQLAQLINLSRIRLVDREQFVWQECDQLLRQQWATTVMQHYRNYRTLAEPKLEAQRIGHELELLWPSYQTIKRSLYKPAHLILKAAMKEADHWLPELLPQLAAWQKEWAAHSRQCWEHHNGPIKGFVYEAPFNAKKHRRQWQFLVLWLGRTAPAPWETAAAAKPPKKPKPS